MERIRVLIADDEPPARSRLRRLLEAHADVEVVGETASGRETVEAIRKVSPDLVFLDIRMGDLDGFGVVEQVGAHAMPAVVFVTAFDRYALDAFEVHALDYLLKPFDDERFEAALERVRGELRRDRLEDLCGRLRSLLDGGGAASSEEAPAAKRRDRLAIRSAGRVVFVDVASIDWVEGAGTYVRLHTGGRSHLLRETLRGLEESLDPRLFLRIHRSAMVNTSRVRELRPLSHGESAVILNDGTELKLSRSYRDRLARLVGG